MTENEAMWMEENEEQVSADAPGMRSVGITPGGIEGDIEAFDTEEPAAEAPAEGGEVAADAAPGEDAAPVTPPPV